jgi:folylpolyglutamate synthase
VNLPTLNKMTTYEKLVAQLIAKPPSPTSLTGIEKLSQIAHYGQILFGGAITIPSVVISGTKGKGSTCSVTESILRHNGLKTGLFTSPHLTTPRERIRINGLAISEAEYVDLYHYVEHLLTKKSLPTLPFFAFHTLMAGIIFRESHVKAAVIECGVGGRYDWTKLFKPKVTGITSLGYDHLDSLGTTPRSISWPKSGICTKTSRNFTTVQDPDFDRELKDHSIQAGIPINTVQPYYTGQMGLRGPCAEENSAVGIALASALAEEIQWRPFTATCGVKEADIGGRFHCLRAKGVDWLLDGAHTLESVQFCNQWYESKQRDPSGDVLLCATTKQRDPLVILAPLMAGKKWKNVIWVQKYNSEIGFKQSIVVEDLPAAIQRAIAEKPGSVLVTGSLHLVGDLLKELGWKPSWLCTP